MATAILAILVLVMAAFSMVLWVDADRNRDTVRKLGLLYEAQGLELAHANRELENLTAERDELLRQKKDWTAIQLGRDKVGPFDKDAKIPSGPRRYVPVAVRRAQAEAESMGPRTHSEQVVANNARAIEQA